MNPEDDKGRLTSTIVNPSTAQAVTSFEYDAIGQVTKVIRPDGAFLVYVYSNARRLSSITDNLGQVVEFTYDAAGNATDRAAIATRFAAPRRAGNVRNSGTMRQ